MASKRLPLSPLRGRQSSLCRAPANGEKGFAKELLTNAGGGADGMTVTNRRLQKLFNLYNRRYFGGRLSYSLQFDTSAGMMDKVFDMDGLKVFVDATSIMYLNGCRVD